MRLLIVTILLCSALAARPLSFERRSSDRYQAWIGSETIVIQPDSITAGGVTLRFNNASASSRLEGIGTASPATYLYARSSRTFPQYPKLALRQLYPGIDVVLYGNGEHLEYDLTVSPGADLHRVRIVFEGAREVRLDADGNLKVEAGASSFLQRLPRVFQADGGRIEASYALPAENQVSFRVGPHNPRLALTIDPELIFTRYFGGSATDSANAITTDAQGNIYIAGTSNSVDFPTSNGIGPRVSAPMAAISAGAPSPLPVSTESSVLAIGGTSDGSVIYAVASDATFVSSDHGATWTGRAALAAPQAFQSLTINNIAVDPVDPSRVFVATSRGLYSTGEGGESWGLDDYYLPVGASGSLNATQVLVSPVNRSIVYLTTAQPAGLFSSSDAGFTWTELNPTYPGKPQISDFQMYAAALGPNGTDLYVVDSYGAMLKSTDGGMTWQPLSLPQQLYGTTAILVDPQNASNIYLTDYSGILRSSDGGATYTMLVAASTVPGGVQRIALDSSSSTLYFGGPQTPVLAVPTEGGAVTTVAGSAPSLHALVTLGGVVYAGFDTPSASYVMKWDPTGSNVLYSMFLGGSAQNSINAIRVDAQGNCTIAGTTNSPDFPVTTKLSNPTVGATSPAGFVTRLSADGTRAVYSSLLGGSATSRGSNILGLALDPSGAAYATGETSSADFPVSANALQSARPTPQCTRPPANFLASADMGVNAFVSKISPDGSQLVYSTLVTGSCGSAGLSLGVDAAGEAMVAGYTTSSDFPATTGSFQAAFPGDPTQTMAPNAFEAGFVAKLSSGGDRLLAGAYLGGSYSTRAQAIALDALGNAFLTGSTAKILPGATQGAYQPTAVDRCAYPFSIGPSLPYTGTGDAFVLKLDPTLSTAGFLTYLGGGCDDSGYGIAIDSSGNSWVTGITESPDFPLKSPFQGSGIGYHFVSEISADGLQLLFSSSTDGVALAIDPGGVVHLVGAGTSSTVPKRAQAFGGSGTAVEWNKIDPAATPAVVIDNVQPVNPYPQTQLEPAGFGTGVAPGELIEITGSDLGPSTQAMGQADSTGRMPFALAGTTVLFDNIPAALVSVAASAVVCLAPFEIGQTTSVTVEANGQRSNSVRLGVRATDAHILTVNNQDGTLNSADHPAKPGDVLVFYVSGLGQTTPLGADGLVNTPPLAVPVASVMAYLPGTTVRPQFVGAAPGQVAGITQVNVLLPAGNYTSNPISVGLNSANGPVYLAQ